MPNFGLNILYWVLYISINPYFSSTCQIYKTQTEGVISLKYSEFRLVDDENDRILLKWKVYAFSARQQRGTAKERSKSHKYWILDMLFDQLYFLMNLSTIYKSLRHGSQPVYSEQWNDTHIRHSVTCVTSSETEVWEAKHCNVELPSTYYVPREAAGYISP